MPTSRCMTPHRVLPFVLGVPLLLLAFSARHPAPVAQPVVARGIPPVGLTHPLPIPIPWQDDEYATGLPADQQSGKRIVRKFVPSRTVFSWKPSCVAWRFRPGVDEPFPSIVDSLTESLVLSLPPPAIFRVDRFGGSVGNDVKSHHS